MGAQAQAIGERLRKHTEMIFKALCLEIDRELRIATPVDTGFARANWVPSVGLPHEGEARKVGSGSSEHAAGVGQVMRFKLEDGTLWVSNSVDYVALALNYGSSSQAPAMFIEAAVDRAVAMIQARYSVRISIDRDPGAGGLVASYSPFGGDE